jgi:hypothetical protein
MMTRKEFLEEVMKMANLKDLKQADDAARAVISLTKLIIGTKLSKKIAKISPPDLREGWESIKPAFPKKPIKIIVPTGPGPDVPTLKELAYDINYVTIRHVVEAPPNTPPHVVRVLEGAFSKAVKEPSYIKWAKKNHVIIDPLGAQEFCKEVTEAYPRIEKFKEILGE